MTLFLGIIMLGLGLLEIVLSKRSVKTYEKVARPTDSPFKLLGFGYGFYIGIVIVLLSLGPIITGIMQLI